MKIKIMTILLIIFSSFAAAQNPPSGQQPSNNSGISRIEVVVMNDDDEHLYGLKADSFKIFIDGMEQQITSVKEINLLKPDQDMPQYSQEAMKENPLYHLILIANIPSDRRLVEKMKDGLIEFLKENEKSGIPMEFFIVNPGEIKKLTEMTDDVNQLSAEIVNAFSSNIFCHEMSFFMENTKFSLIDNLSAFINTIGKLNGTKRIVFLSAGIPDTFGLDNYDTGLAGISSSTASSPETLSRQQAASLDQQRYESKRRKEFSDKLMDFSKILSPTDIKLDFVDLSKSFKSTRSEEGMASSRSASTISSSNTSEFSLNRDQYNVGVQMKTSSEVKLRIAKDLVRIGGGELFEKALSSSDKIAEYLNQILYKNGHYYIIEYNPKISDDEEKSLKEIKIEVKNDDAEKVIFNQYILMN